MGPRNYQSVMMAGLFMACHPPHYVHLLEDGIGQVENDSTVTPFKSPTKTI